jgi:hypothetical protein
MIVRATIVAADVAICDHHHDQSTCLQFIIAIELPVRMTIVTAELARSFQRDCRCNWMEQ